MVCLECGAARHYDDIDPAEKMLPKAETLPN